ncbi:MAG: hypothetical protein EAY68_07545, partial [Bacteroidetes bacterium]
DYYEARNELAFSKKLQKTVFFATVADIESETGISYREQKTAIKVLEEKGFISTVLMNTPATLHFCVNEKTCFDFFANQDLRKCQNLICGNDKSSFAEMSKHYKEQIIKKDQIDPREDFFEKTAEQPADQKIKIQNILEDQTADPIRSFAVGAAQNLDSETAETEKIAKILNGLIEGKAPDEIKLARPAFFYYSQIQELKKDLDFVKSKVLEYAQTASLSLSEGIDKVWKSFVSFLSKAAEPEFILDKAKFKQFIKDLAEGKPAEQWAYSLKKPQFVSQRWSSICYGKEIKMADIMTVLEKFLSSERDYNDISHAINIWFIYIEKAIANGIKPKITASKPSHIMPKATKANKVDYHFGKNKRVPNPAVEQEKILQAYLPKPTPSVFENLPQMPFVPKSETLWEKVDKFFAKASQSIQDMAEISAFILSGWRLEAEDEGNKVRITYETANTPVVKIRDLILKEFSQEVERGALYVC